MIKGKYGIALSFYAIVAFVLAALGQVLLCGVLLGFVLVAEKNDWLSRQVMQALFLSFLKPAVSLVLGVLNVFDRWPFNEVFFFRNTVLTLFNWIGTIVSIIVVIFAIIGILKTAKNQDAGLPILSTWANKAFGLVEHKVYTQTPPYPPQNPQGPQVPPQNPQQ